MELSTTAPSSCAYFWTPVSDCLTGTRDTMTLLFLGISFVSCEYSERAKQAGGNAVSGFTRAGGRAGAAAAAGGRACRTFAGLAVDDAEGVVRPERELVLLHNVPLELAHGEAHAVERHRLEPLVLRLELVVHRRHFQRETNSSTRCARNEGERRAERERNARGMSAKWSVN